MAREPREQLDHLVAPHRREPAHHAEVDQRDAVAGQVQDVAGMRIRVKEAVHQDHLEHGVRAPRRERLTVEARSIDRAKSLPRMPMICSCTFITRLVHWP